MALLFIIIINNDILMKINIKVIVIKYKSYIFISLKKTKHKQLKTRNHGKVNE